MENQPESNKDTFDVLATAIVMVNGVTPTDLTTRDKEEMSAPDKNGNSHSEGDEEMSTLGGVAFFI